MKHHFFLILTFVVCSYFSGAAQQPYHPVDYFGEKLKELQSIKPLSPNEENKLRQSFDRELCNNPQLVPSNALKRAISSSLTDEIYIRYYYKNDIESRQERIRKGMLARFISGLNLSTADTVQLNKDISEYAATKAFYEYAYVADKQYMKYKTDSLNDLYDTKIKSYFRVNNGMGLTGDFKMVFDHAEALKLTTTQKKNIIAQFTARKNNADKRGLSSLDFQHTVLKEVLSSPQYIKYIQIKKDDKLQKVARSIFADKVRAGVLKQEDSVRSVQAFYKIELRKEVAKSRYSNDPVKVNEEIARLNMKYQSITPYNNIALALRLRTTLDLTEAQTDTIISRTVELQKKTTRAALYWEAERQILKDEMNDDQFVQFITRRNQPLAKDDTHRQWQKLKHYTQDLDSLTFVRKVFPYILSLRISKDYYLDNPEMIKERTDFLRKSAMPKELRVLYFEKRKAGKTQKETTE